MLELLATQPEGSVWLEDLRAVGVPVVPEQLLSEWGDMARGAQVEWYLKNATDAERNGNAGYSYWAAERQGFIFPPAERRYHYFIHKGYWPERKRLRNDPRYLQSLCRRTEVFNRLPVEFPDLDDPLLCKDCLRKVLAAQQEA